MENNNHNHNGSPRISLFYCATNRELQERIRGQYGSNGIKLIPVPCSGKVDTLYLTKAFETGADGVAVVTCGKGDCRYLEGNLRAEKRVGFVDSLMSEIGLDGRIEVIETRDGVDHVISSLESFRNKIEILSGTLAEIKTAKLPAQVH
jgi:coenzyme F420-reducing hydrogenase delta subunit